MRRLSSLLLFVIILTFSTKGFATSWVELDPEEVIARAEVIVIGTYDFTSKPKKSKSVFQGLEFNVEGVYKGEAPKNIIAGIDEFDNGWVSEFQEEGGEFLLFLEKIDDAPFLVPVAGPNGMIQVLEGKVKYESNVNKEFYEEILAEQPEVPRIGENETEDQRQGLFRLLLIISLGVVVIFVTISLNKK